MNSKNQQELKDMATSALHLLTKLNIITIEQIDACDTYSQIQSLIDTELLILLRDERLKL